MPLDADWVVDRRRLKRHLTAWRLIALAALVAGTVAAFGLWNGSARYLRGDHVARIDVQGLILNDQAVQEKLDFIAAAPGVKALIVRINSGGGTVVGGEQMFKTLRRVAETKPVVAVMGELATSAAYMIALGADRIFASPGTVTGSVGVILQSVDVTRLLDKLGIEAVNIKSTPLKAQPNPLEPLSADARVMVESVIRDFHSFFVALVAERRGLAPTAAQSLGDGRIFSGRQALAGGLIDAIGGEREARAWLAETRGVSMDMPVTDLNDEDGRDLFRYFLEGAFGKALFSERLSLDGLVSVWHPSLR